MFTPCACRNAGNPACERGRGNRFELYLPEKWEAASEHGSVADEASGCRSAVGSSGFLIFPDSKWEDEDEDENGVAPE